MKSNKRTFTVFNATDGFYASPDIMTKEEAETFVKQFPERYRAQGYYRTGRWEKIRPEDVALKIVPFGINPFIEPEDKAKNIPTEERRNETNDIRKKKVQKNKGLQR